MAHTDTILETWTESTRPKILNKNTFGYNIEKQRIEFYIKLEDKWYYLWRAACDLECPPSVPTIFQDNFMEGWIVDNTFIKLFEDNFNTQWREENVFTKIFSDFFENNWFVNNTFNQIFIENFESEDWLV